MKLYSDKAYAIIEAVRKSEDWSPKLLKRGADGEVVIMPYLLKKAFQKLWDIGWTPGARSAAVRAADTEERAPFYRVKDFKIDVRTASLVAALIHDTYKINVIRNHWGDEAVDEMIGAPLNALESARRATLLEEIEKVKADSQDRQRILLDEHCRESDDACRPFNDKIAALQAKVEEIQQEMEAIAAERSAVRKKLDEKWRAAYTEINDKTKAKLDELQAALEQ